MEKYICHDNVALTKCQFLCFPFHNQFRPIVLVGMVGCAVIDTGLVMTGPVREAHTHVN